MTEMSLQNIKEKKFLKDINLQIMESWTGAN